MRFLLFTVSLGIMLIASCGGNSGTDTQAVDSRQLAFERELDALPIPAGMDPKLWEDLKTEFREVMAAIGYSHTASLAPTSALSAVDDLAITALPDGSAALEWGYRNQGDYNQDKLVAVSDFTEVGRYYEMNQSSPDWDRARFADGSADGRVTSADITQLGQYYLQRVEGYKVFASATPEVPGSWVETSQVEFAASTIPEGQYERRFSCSIAAPADGTYYRVQPYDGTNVGIAGNTARFNAIKPQVTVQVPTVLLGGEDAGWEATWSNGSAPYTITWDFGGGASNLGPMAATTPDVQTVTMVNDSHTEPAGYTYTVTVADTFGVTGIATGAYTVNPNPHPVVTVTVPEDMRGGFNAEWGADWVGGTAPFTIAWEFGGGSTDTGPEPAASPAGLTTTMLNPSNTTPADYTYTVTVTDDLGYSGVASGEYSVGPDPHPVVTVDVPTGMGGELEATWSAQWMNGTPPYTITWEFGGGAPDLGPMAATSPQPQACTMVNPSQTEDANYSYTVTVTDFEGLSGVATGDYIVGPSPNYDPEIISANFTLVTATMLIKATDANDDETLTVSITEPPGLHADATSKQASSTGLLSASFIWTADDPGIGGTGTSTVTVTDSLGATDVTTVEINVPVRGAIYAIPQVETAAVGEAVTILVTTDVPGFPFQQMCMVGLTVEPGASLVSDSFNVGAIGGATNFPDGIWAGLSPSSFMTSGGSPWHEDNGDGLDRWEFSIMHPGGSNLEGVGGDLFNFQFTFAAPGTYTLGFVQSTGGVSRTYYGDQDEYEYFWGDLSNDHAGIAHSIVVE